MERGTVSIFHLKFHQMILGIGLLIFATNVGAAFAKSVPKRVCGNPNEQFALYNQKVWLFAI